MLDALLEVLPSLSYKDRISHVNSFLQQPENRQSLTKKSLIRIIDAVFCMHISSDVDTGSASLLRVLLAYDKTRHLLVGEFSKSQIARLICMNLYDVYQLCHDNLKTYILYDDSSTNEALFSFDEVSLFFSKTPEKEKVFSDEIFSFYFNHFPDLALSIYQSLDGEDDKTIFLRSKMMVSKLSKNELIDCLKTLPSVAIGELVVQPFIREKISDADVVDLLSYMDESGFLSSMNKSDDFLSTIPSFQFYDSPLILKVTRFSQAAKMAMFMNNKFMSMMNSDCQNIFFESFTLDAKLEVLRSDKLLKMKKGVIERKIKDDTILSLLFSKNSDGVVSDFMSVEEILSLLLELDDSHLHIMNYICNEIFLSRLEDNPKLIRALATFIQRKFSEQEIYAFLTTPLYQRIFYDVLDKNAMIAILKKSPWLTVAILKIPGFIEHKIGVDSYHEIVDSINDEFDDEFFYRQVSTSSEFRRILSDSPRSAVKLSLNYFFANPALDENTILNMFEVDAGLLDKCNLDRWLHYFYCFYKESENKEELALSLLQDIILQNEEVSDLKVKAHFLNALNGISPKLLAKLLLKGDEELSTLLLSKIDEILAFSPSILPLIFSASSGEDSDNIYFVIEQMLENKRFSQDFYSGFDRAIFYIKALSVNKSLSMILDFSTRKNMNEYQWKTLIKTLKNENRVDILDALFFDKDFLKNAGGSVVVYAMNLGVLKKSHLVSFEKDDLINSMLSSNDVIELLKKPENLVAKKQAMKIPLLQKQICKEEIFDKYWDDKALKLPSFFCLPNDKLPHHIRKMREAFDKGKDISTIKKIAHDAAKNQRYWLWNTRKKEVQKFYEDIANIEKPFKQKDIAAAKALTFSKTTYHMS